MSDKFITPEEFCEAWKKVWADKDKNQMLSDKFTDDGTWGEWTDCMLAGDNSFLACVAKQLGFQQDCTKTNYYQVEYQRFDMALMSDWNEGYPYHLDAVIEHENAKHPENEMWKLMLLRSPLKVIIFYDHCKVDLSEKLTELKKMLEKANAAFPENKKTEYLFIIGAGEVKGEPLKWRRASHKKLSPQNLC